MVDTLQAPIEDESDPADRAEFEISAPGEIQAHLKALCEACLPFSLTVPGASPVTTCLVAVDAATNSLAFAADLPAGALAPLLQGQAAVAVAYNESVKFQLRLTALTLRQDEQGAALVCPVPPSMLRFQRRRSFRAKTPARGGPMLRMQHPRDPSVKLALKVLDISTGGCGLEVPPEAPPIREGTYVKGARLELDLGTHLQVDLEIQRSSQVISADGSPKGTRLSCRWLRLTGQAERSLQMYTDQLQRRSRMLSGRAG